MNGLKRLTGVIGAVIIFAALAFNACSKDEGVTGPITLQGNAAYAVGGYVYDTHSGQPVPYVHLEFYDDGYIGDTYTDYAPGWPDHGHYDFYLGSERINHQIWVYASKPGYFSNWTWFIYYPGPSYEHNINIQPKDHEINSPPRQ